MPYDVRAGRRDYKTMANITEESDFDSDFDIHSSSFEESSDNETTEDVRPYMFEPTIDEKTVVDVDVATENERLSGLRLNDVSEWCHCGNCEAMPADEECVCCLTIDNTKEKAKTQQKSCIVDHPGFDPVCLNAYVLETAYYQYRQQYGDRDEDDENAQKRYTCTAYRQLVRWCWGYLGKEVRVVLPSCAVTKIRKTYPSDTYTGFCR